MDSDVLATEIVQMLEACGQANAVDVQVTAAAAFSVAAVAVELADAVDVVMGEVAAGKPPLA